MTTFHDQITSLPTTVSSLSTFESSASTFDLFHFPENDFKDAHRQRIQKNRDRSIATTSTVNYRIRRSTAASSEDQTIRRKVDLRLKNNGSCSNSNSSSDEYEQDLGDKRKKDKDRKNKQQETTRVQLSQLVDVDRSNKRADRRTKFSEEEIMQLQQQKHHQHEVEDEDTGYSSGDSSSCSFDSSTRRGGRRHGGFKGQQQVTEAEERIRFKHNLVFPKGNDDGTMATKRIDAQSFQKVFEKKLDEKDQFRSHKHSNVNSKRN